MQAQFARITAIMLAVSIIFLAGCSQPTPIVIVITAVPPPTLTPLPSLPVATITPQSLVPLPPTNTPVPPQQPAGPTATPVLIQLGVFDQGPGTGKMQARVFGGQVGKLLVFRAVACAPDCNGKPDGNNINTVQFTIYKLPNENSDSSNGQVVYDHTEGAAPYCAFGGDNKCDYFDISNSNVKWPDTNKIAVQNGFYALRFLANGKNDAMRNGEVNFKIQR